MDHAVAERRGADLPELGIADPEVTVGARAVAALEQFGLKLEEILLDVVLERGDLLAVALAAPGFARRPVEVAKEQT